MKFLSADNPRTHVFGRFVKDLATLSKCEQRGVAAVITDRMGSQVYAIGVNGGPKGGPQCLCGLGGKYLCVHAEANAIAKDRSNDEDKVMFTSLAPCPTCAALMINSGIRRLFYLEPWKDHEGLHLLQEAGIPALHLDLKQSTASFLGRDYEQQLVEEIRKEAQSNSGDTCN